MSDVASDRDNYCYRHPDRQSFVLCQRCGRTICAQCQTQAAVGVHCPECVREARGSAPRARRFSNPFTANGNRPVVTYTLIGVNIAIWVLEILPIVGDYVYAYGAYAPSHGYTERFPWTMLTSAFLHDPGNIFHVLLNMLSLFFIGPALETMLGRWRYLALYIVGAFGGSVAVLVIAPNSIVVGASGAIFGLLAAYFIIARRLGTNGMQILVIIAINLVYGFFVPGVAWQAHVGGLITGAAIALIYMATRNRRQRPAQIAGVAGVAALLIVITIVTATIR